MNAELLYTSAPQGLKQGSRGFCTVLSTVGMPLNIATKLESLSGYRHLHPSGTPDAAKNPVNHSHLKLTVGGRTLSVISRISDYGLDYSQRTNKLAHHVVVDSPMPACGPAALLGDPSVIRSEWDGNCVNIPAPPSFPALSVEPVVCQAWESIAGDAGWAGVVANAWLNNASKPIFLIFSEDQSPEILPLIAEAIAILPPSKRWQATFGTYVTNLPPDVDCKVRCVVAGSDEARMASARGVVIDLTSPLGQAASSDAVDAARSGRMIGRGASSIAVPPSTYEKSEQTIPVQSEPIHDDEELELVHDFDPERPFGETTVGAPPSLRMVKKEKSLLPGPVTGTSERKFNQRTTAVVIGLAAIAIAFAGIAIILFKPRWTGLDVTGIGDQTTNIALTEEKESDDRGTKPIEKEHPSDLAPDKKHVDAGKKPPPTENKFLSDEEYALIKDKIKVKIFAQDIPEIHPVAIRGKAIVAELHLDNDTPITPVMMDAFRRFKEKAEYVLLSENDGNPVELGKNESGVIIVPLDCKQETCAVTVKKNNLSQKSTDIPIIDAAKAEDFELSLTGSECNNKEIAFCFPGERIKIDVKIINKNPHAEQYLQHFSRNAVFTLVAQDKDLQVSIIKDTYSSEIIIPTNATGENLKAYASFPNNAFQISTHPICFIDSLTGLVSISPSFDTNLLMQPVDFRNKNLNAKYGKIKPEELLSIDQILDPKDSSPDAQALRVLIEEISYLKDKLKVVNEDLGQFYGVLKNDINQSGLLRELSELCEGFRISLSEEPSKFKEIDRSRSLVVLASRINELTREVFKTVADTQDNQVIMKLEGNAQKRHPIDASVSEPNKSENMVKFLDEVAFFKWYLAKKKSNARGYLIFNSGMTKILEVVPDVAFRMNKLDLTRKFRIDRPLDEICAVGETGDLVTNICHFNLPVCIRFTSSKSKAKGKSGMTDSKVIPQQVDLPNPGN